MTARDSVSAKGAFHLQVLAEVVGIQPAKPEVIYVPSYNPRVVFGDAPDVPYPAIVCPTTSYRGRLSPR